MEERIGLSVLGREFLLHGSLRRFEEGVVFGMLGDQVSRRAFGAVERQALAVLAPGFAKEAADLFSGRVEHGQSDLEGADQVADVGLTLGEHPGRHILGDR